MSDPFSFTLVFAVGGQIRHCHPDFVEEQDRSALIAIAARALKRRLALETASAETKPPTPKPAAPVQAITPTMTQGEMARAQGYAGECCAKCGGWRMKQAGHCMVCDDCGETTGCS